MPRKPSTNLTPAAVEATADAFLAAFKALPGKVKWRIMQKLEEYEDELEEAQLAADIAANPNDYARENAVPWEQVKAEMNAGPSATKAQSEHRKAA